VVLAGLAVLTGLAAAAMVNVTSRSPLDGEPLGRRHVVAVGIRSNLSAGLPLPLALIM
jgi:hypothetical protein